MPIDEERSRRALLTTDLVGWLSRLRDPGRGVLPDDIKRSSAICPCSLAMG
jgi:hypothetical protein